MRAVFGFVLIIGGAWLCWVVLTGKHIGGQNWTIDPMQPVAETGGGSGGTRR